MAISSGGSAPLFLFLFSGYKSQGRICWSVVARVAKPASDQQQRQVKATHSQVTSHVRCLFCNVGAAFSGGSDSLKLSLFFFTAEKLVVA